MEGDPYAGSSGFRRLPRDAQKRILLEKYGAKEPNPFAQLDGFLVGKDHEDSVMRPDDDGDCLMSGATHELMWGADVRILIKKGTAPTDAIRLIRKLGDWLSLAPGLAAPAALEAGTAALLDGIAALDDFKGSP